MPKKQVSLTTYSPIQYHPEYEARWDDIYISYKVRPGKRVNLGPTLIGYNDFLEDLTYTIKNNGREIKYEADSLASSLGIEPFEPYILDLNEELNELNRVKEELKTNFVAICSSDYGTPTIYTSAPMITKKVAERMIAELMASIGFKSVSMRWRRNKNKFYIHSF
jgi:hypothetical protein